MNIGKYFRWLRRGKQLSWQRSHLLSHDLDVQGRTKIVEYQDRWTKAPSREPMRLDDAGSHTYRLFVDSGFLLALNPSDSTHLSSNCSA